MDPILGIGIGSLHPIQSQFIGQLGSGGAIRYRYLVSARSIWVPDWDCNAIPIPIQYHFDTIPWDWITLSDPIPYFLIPVIEKSIRSDKLADTVSDRICFTVAAGNTATAALRCKKRQNSAAQRHPAFLGVKKRKRQRLIATFSASAANQPLHAL
ncbi:Kinesin-like protein kif20a [Puccinia graminis f. sp. tritici]|uniref:Kinesin-like protein kif20a n=1 Tax=Puccinia graminis f. sp. tritici TaxID=56615 RepID=A0A5B0RU32_PUCGR|nr:Kinesin-like protein kif20a [Puccinia graminis f. sp. tritici]